MVIYGSRVNFLLNLGSVGNVKACHAMLHVGMGVLSCVECAWLPVPATVVTCLPFVLFSQTKQQASLQETECVPHEVEPPSGHAALRDIDLTFPTVLHSQRDFYFALM